MVHERDRTRFDVFLAERKIYLVDSNFLRPETKLVARTIIARQTRVPVQQRTAIRHSSRHSFMALAAALLIAAPATGMPALHAQTTAPASAATSRPTFTVNARLVVLDVVVTDKTGKPVDDLTEKDFQILEDGEQQRIRSVELPSAHQLPPASAAVGASEVFDPAQPASFGHSPVTILVLDQLNTHFADSSFARRSLHDYLAGQPALLLQPATLLSVYDNRFKLLQPFTRDRDALLRALAGAPTEYAWKLEVNGSADYGPIERLDQSLRALEDIAQSYARIPGRKSLIWVGGGFPTIDPTSVDSRDAQEVKDTLQHVTNSLLDARVTLYAIDPSSSAASVTEITNIDQQSFAQAAGDSLSGASDPFSASADFDRLGPVTGGRVIRGKNDIALQIASSVELGANFYTIAYTPSSTSEAAAQFRKISVVCLRPGLTATTRSGYYAGAVQQESSAGTAAYDLTTAAESTIPLNGLRVTAEPDTSPGAPPSTYIVRAGAANLTWKPQPDGSATASVYIMAASLNAKNRMFNHTLQGMIASAKPGANLRDPSRTADFIFTVPPAPRSATLRFVVRDSATGRMGSVDLPQARH
jgi:VWFA-related protein